MGKKKAKKSDSTRARVELRLDQEVLDGLKRTAEASGISVNQYVHALTRWANDNVVQGEPRRDENGFVYSEDQKGCMFLGKLPRRYEDWERQAREEATGVDPGEFAHRGEVFVSFDFTERRVIKED